MSQVQVQKKVTLNLPTNSMFAVGVYKESSTQYCRFLELKLGKTRKTKVIQ